jgi:hypothetical protein
MAPNQHPARTTATRGSLSARQWQDLRQAARLARSEGVSFTWHRDGSILISPAPQVSNHAGNRQRGQQVERPAAPDPQPMDTQPMETVDSPRQQSKKQQRDAERLQKWRAKQPASQSAARWSLLTKPLLWRVRRTHLDATFTAWMRTRLEARRMLRSVLWREWTRPQIEPPPLTVLSPASGIRVIPTGLQILGARSLRDEYILKRSRALLHRVFDGTGPTRAIWWWLSRRDLARDSTPTLGARSPGAAGLTTPVSARNRKKPRGRGGRGGMSP